MTGDPLGAGSLLQLVLGLGLVLALIGGAAWASRRFGRLPLGPGNGLRVLGAVAVGARERVVLVEVGEAQLLLGVAPGRVQALHVLAKPLALPQGGSR